MHKSARIAGYLFAALLGTLTAASNQAAEPATLSYLHLYADSKGESHFKTGKLPFEVMRREGRSGGPLAHRLADTDGAMFLHLKSGAFEDWHTAPRQWFLIAVQGISEVTASDGEKRQLKPGMIMLMGDTTGKGHQTRAIGPEDHVALVVPFKE